MRLYHCTFDHHSYSTLVYVLLVAHPSLIIALVIPWSLVLFLRCCPQVIYGDTDSVMIHTNSNDLAAVKEMGE